MKWNIILVFLIIFIAGCTTTNDSLDDSIVIEDAAPTENVEEENVEEVNTDVQNDGVRRVIVKGGSFYFEPSLIEVEVGETLEIVFENDGGVHDLVIPSLDIGTSIINTGESESFTYTFDEAGSFDFECSVGSHAANGMVGKIIVS